MDKAIVIKAERHVPNKHSCETVYKGWWFPIHHELSQIGKERKIDKCYKQAIQN